MKAQIERLIRQMAGDPRCHVEEPVGLPTMTASLDLPADLRRFYELCGGAHLFPGHDYGCTIARPSELLPANPLLVGKRFPGDRSESWFVVARSEDDALAVVDLAESRRGRCYDAFHEVYGIVGSMPVIAGCFSDLLASLVSNEGRHWYWLEPAWTSLGDAYD